MNDTLSLSLSQMTPSPDPSPRGLTITHKFGGGERAHQTIHGGVVSEVLEAAPEGDGSRIAIGGAGEEAAELGDPADGLAQGGRRGWRGRGAMDDAVEGLPLVRVEEARAGQVRHRPCQQGGEEDAPGDDAVERQAASEPVGRLELSGLDLAAALEDLVPDFDAPAADVVVDQRERLFDGRHGAGREQQPLDRGDVGWWRGLDDPDG